MKKKSKDAEMYTITLKGLIAACPGIDAFQINYIWDTIELYSLRHKKNAVLLKECGTFVNVDLVEE